jgi:hypothetical protein
MSADPAYVETPIFTGIRDFAISYLFEVSRGRDNEVDPPRAFRLESIHDALNPESSRNKDLSEAEREAKARIYDGLIEPIRSYHDDVTTGGPGRGGRPLVFTAESPDQGFEQRSVDLLLPDRWEYRAEGRLMRMHAPAGAAGRRIPLEFRDTFCAFESGRLFYMLTFYPPAPSTHGLDEYALIALEKLASRKPEGRKYLEAWRFDYAGRAASPDTEIQGVTLLELASARLARLSKAAIDHPNGLRQIVQPLLYKGDYAPPTLTQADIRSLLVCLEDETLLGFADQAFKLKEDFDLGSLAGDGDWPGASTPEGFLLHRDEEEEKPGYRPFLALAGMLQSVIDFPYQDQVELFDSTRPVFSGNGFYLYAHPDFTLEICADERSLHDCRASLGTCPYLSLMWVVAIHDELIVTEIEEAIDVLIYGKDEGDMAAEPLAGLARVLRSMKRLAGSPTAELHANLDRRFQLFRTHAINRSHYLFRYAKEKEALRKIEAASGTSDRFQRAQETIDRLESLIEDVTGLRSAYAERRTNIMLAMIAVLSIVSVASDFEGQWTGGFPRAFWLVAGLGIVAVLLILFSVPAWHSLRGGLRRLQERRSRKSS